MLAPAGFVTNNKFLDLTHPLILPSYTKNQAIITTLISIALLVYIFFL